MKKIIFFFSFFLFTFGFSQQTESLRLKKFEVAVLNDSIQETSALNFFNGKLFTLNDSGNTAELFEIDSASGKILNVLKTGLKNKDWEALTNDGKYFYIGDFGNNAGTRKDLNIYKIPFKHDSLKTDSIRKISFYYPEQKEFTPKNINNNFDAESMIFLDGKVHVFTKEWISKGVSHYVIDPEISENQSAIKTEFFQTDFVVTDASYFENRLYLVGYTKMTQVYLMIFDQSENGTFFQSKSQKFHLGSALSIGQIEGIAVNSSGIYISGEAFRSPLGTQKQRLYFIPKKEMPEL